VLVRPPTVAASIGTRGLFTRVVGSSVAMRHVPVALDWGGFAALGCAVICAATVLSSLAASYRQPAT
jgi:sugar phosphate permease